MWKNKLNGKKAKQVVFNRTFVHFKIDGIEESLPIKIFKEYYEKIL